jgi:hypothetical protein
MTQQAARRAPIAMLLALAVGASGGCAASTVSGRGSAAVSSPTESATNSDFPAPGISTPIVAPSSELSTPPPSEYTKVAVTDEAGHFRVRMPATPTRSDQPGSFGDYTFNVHLVIVQSPYAAIVEGEDVSPALTSDTFDTVLKSAVTGFASSSGLSKVSEKATTFRGHEGRIAIFDRAGTNYEFLVFVQSGSQIYALFAPEGDRFDALAGSFEATV